MKIADRFKNFKGYDCHTNDKGIHLDKNESPFDLQEEMKDEILEEIRDIPLNRYPPLRPEKLEKKLAEYVGFSEDNVCIGNGSDDIIPMIFELFDADQVIISTPTFSMYSFYAKKRGLKINKVPLNENFEIPPFFDSIKKFSIVCICSPNSPTGNVQPREKIIKALESDNIVILDEAYGEFAEETSIDLIDKYDNLIVLRTLSKAFGLASLRVGYAVGSSEIIEYLNRIRSPFSQDMLSIKIAKKVLDDTGSIKENVKKIIDERERIFKRFKQFAYPSETNFILMDLDAYEYLNERGIHVRKMSGRLEGMIRVTVGKKEENDELISALDDFVEGSIS